MASIKIKGNDLGAGSLTVVGPNTASDLTVNIPASSGDLVIKDSSGQISLGGTGVVFQEHPEQAYYVEVNGQGGSDVQLLLRRSSSAGVIGIGSKADANGTGAITIGPDSNSMNYVAEFRPTETVFNPDSNAVDFRVSTAGSGHGLFVDHNESVVKFGMSGTLTQSGDRYFTAQSPYGIMFGSSQYTTSYIGNRGNNGQLYLVANASPGNLGVDKSIYLQAGTSGGGGPNTIAQFDNTGSHFYNGAVIKAPGQSYYGAKTESAWAGFYTSTAGASRYVHVVLPSSWTNDAVNGMWLVHITGAALNASPYVIDVWVHAYSAAIGNGGPISNVGTSTNSANWAPTAYHSSTYNAGVARIYLPDSYYTTLNVSAQQVGNGTTVLPGEFTVVFSNTTTI